MSRGHLIPLGRAVHSTTAPKPGGGLRRLTLLGPAEAAAYARAVQRVAPMVERRLGPEVFANRTPGGGSFEPWWAARVRWRRAAGRLARAEGVVTMDVRACYDSITHEVAGAALCSIGVPFSSAEEVVRLLRIFRDAGVPGIPIGPEPSAVIANAVLAAVDDALRARGVRFIRWVDDLAMAVDPLRVGVAELEVERTLGALGLRTNPRKHIRLSARDEARDLLLGSPNRASGAEILAGS